MREETSRCIQIIDIGKGRAKAATNPDWKEPDEVVYSVDGEVRP